jgi:hypothetical protein
MSWHTVMTKSLTHKFFFVDKYFINIFLCRHICTSSSRRLRKSGWQIWRRRKSHFRRTQKTPNFRHFLTPPRKGENVKIVYLSAASLLKTRRIIYCLVSRHPPSPGGGGGDPPQTFSLWGVGFRHRNPLSILNIEWKSFFM